MGRRPKKEPKLSSKNATFLWRKCCNIKNSKMNSSSIAAAVSILRRLYLEKLRKSLFQLMLVICKELLAFQRLENYRWLGHIEHYVSIYTYWCVYKLKSLFLLSQQERKISKSKQERASFLLVQESNKKTGTRPWSFRKLWHCFATQLNKLDFKPRFSGFKTGKAGHAHSLLVFHWHTSKCCFLIGYYWKWARIFPGGGASVKSIFEPF